MSATGELGWGSSNLWCWIHDVDEGLCYSATRSLPLSIWPPLVLCARLPVHVSVCRSVGALVPPAGLQVYYAPLLLCWGWCVYALVKTFRQLRRRVQRAKSQARPPNRPSDPHQCLP